MVTNMFTEFTETLFRMNQELPLPRQETEA
jgi:hypothetical protein